MSSSKKIIIFLCLCAGILAAGLAAFFSFKAPEANLIKEEGPAEVQISSQIYRHPKYNFTFEYPDEFRLTEVEEANGDIILAEGKEIGSGFQIFVIPFDEAGPITLGRIKKDLPNMVMENLTEIKLDAISALSFVGMGEGYRTAEVWVGNAGFLYQITARLENAKLMEQILSTWKFQQ